MSLYQKALQTLRIGQSFTFKATECSRSVVMKAAEEVANECGQCKGIVFFGWMSDNPIVSIVRG